MNSKSPFQEAVDRIDAANADDPRTDDVAGRTEPRELRFAVRVFEWIQRLVESPSEALLLAARGHTIRRWAIPRDQYPMDNVGYHIWRKELAGFHASETARILHEVGYDDETVDRVGVLIRRERFPEDPEACALEDADCLAFLELKLHRFLDAWDDEKMQRILRNTYAKMTPRAQALVGTLTLSQAEQQLLQQAIEDSK